MIVSFLLKLIFLIFESIFFWIFLKNRVIPSFFLLKILFIFGFWFLKRFFIFFFVFFNCRYREFGFEIDAACSVQSLHEIQAANHLGRGENLVQRFSFL